MPAQLSDRRIAEVALAMLDEQGVAGFSMRSVARAFNVTPMALYHHFSDKAALAALVIKVSQEGLPFPAPVDDWQENIWNIAAWMRRCSLAHPAILELRRTYDVWTADFHELANRWMGSWKRSGLDTERAIRAATTSSAAISGLVADELGKRQRRYRPSNPDLPSLPNADLLLETAGDADQMFELGVRSILEGLHTRLMREQSAETPAP